VIALNLLSLHQYDSTFLEPTFWQRTATSARFPGLRMILVTSVSQINTILGKKIEFATFWWIDLRLEQSKRTSNGAE
jgi:hypothetical protein